MAENAAVSAVLEEVKGITESLTLSSEERVEDKEDNTDVEDFSLVDNSDLLARPPKIWISKTASMEHDLD